MKNNIPPVRVGHGVDVHPFAEGRKLILGGVEIPSERGLAGHSDADVIAHALCNAALGGAGLGDLGRHFPDSDPAWKDVSGAELLAMQELIRETVLASRAVNETVGQRIGSKLGGLKTRLAWATSGASLQSPAIVRMALQELDPWLYNMERVFPDGVLERSIAEHIQIRGVPADDRAQG